MFCFVKPPLSKGVSAACLALFGNLEERMLLFIASVTGLIRYSLAIFTNFGGIWSSKLLSLSQYLEKAFLYHFLGFFKIESTHFNYCLHLFH